jgi:hypothetical protein
MQKMIRSTLSILFVFLLSACQGVFTTSPVSFLQRDPSNFSIEQKIEYGWDALASGDMDAMIDAFDALRDDAMDSEDGEVTYLAAQLAMELSGASGILMEILEGNIDLSGELDTESIDSFIDGLDDDYLTDSADFFDRANTYDAEMEGTDYLLGGACMLFSVSSSEPGGVGDLGQAEVLEIQNFLNDGLDKIDPGDPARDDIQNYLDFLSDPLNFP